MKTPHLNESTIIQTLWHLGDHINDKKRNLSHDELFNLLLDRIIDLAACEYDDGSVERFCEKHGLDEETAEAAWWRDYSERAGAAGVAISRKR